MKLTKIKKICKKPQLFKLYYKKLYSIICLILINKFKTLTQFFVYFSFTAGQ
jgi:hypothetical protein